MICKEIPITIVVLSFSVQIYVLGCGAAEEVLVYGVCVAKHLMRVLS